MAIDKENTHQWAGPGVPPPAAELADRYAIGQLARIYCLGVDTRDLALARSIFADECVAEGSSGWGGPIDEYLPQIIKGVSAFQVTQHNITNQYITIDGDEALCWNYAIAVHKVVPDADRPHFDLGVTYRDTCRRFADGWKIVHRKVVLHWNQTYPKESGK